MFMVRRNQKVHNMKIRRKILYLTTTFFSTLFYTSANAEAPIPLSQQLRVNDSLMQQLSLPRLDNAQLRSRDAAARVNNTAPVLRYAEPMDVSITPENGWQNVRLATRTEQMSVWRMTVNSPGALSLNLGFTDYYMPAGASLFIYTPDGKHRLRPFTSEDNEAHGQLWTPMVPGDTLILEVNVPVDKKPFLRLKLEKVNHGYLGSNMREVYDQVQIMSGSCNVDVVCPEGDAWQEQIRSVAAISTGGSLFCTGSALNNTANDGRGFFLTADHCGINSGNAASLVTYWNYQNSYCRTPGSSDSGGSGDGSLNDFNTGSVFRAGFDDSDFTLVELDDPFDPNHLVYLSGWNANPTLNTSAVGIHHPNVDEKRISFENDPVVRTNAYSNTPNANGTHVRIIDWDLGTTEPGSSGSPLFDQNHRIIGQLTGGSAACGNNSSDWYGAMAANWNGGGTNSSRVSNWLDANNTGQMAIDGMEASNNGGGQDPNAAFSFNCDTLNCTFDASGSTDSDGNIVSYSWSFGDGSNGSGVNPNHSYSSAGNYTVTLTVTDNDNRTDSLTKTVTVGDVNDGELSNGVPVSNLSGSTGETQEFYLVVPADATKVTFTMSGGSGDADLYVRFGSKPTTSAYDCRPYTGGNNETCEFNAQAGTYYVMVRAYNTYSGVSLVGSYETGNGGGDSGSNLNISLSSKDWFRHTIDVPAGTQTLTVTTSGGSGDADLYLRFGSAPTTSTYECRSWTSSNNESCVINNPAAGTWHVGVHAYRAISGVNEQWEYQ